MTPRVSVCIPAYNHARFLNAAIESALAQTLGDLEVVVSDNASSDDTREVVGRLASRDRRVRYELAPRHLTMAESFNRSIELAKGRYIKLLCADDVLEPECVQRLVAALESEGALLAGCARNFVEESLAKSVAIRRFAPADWAGSGEQAARRCFFRGNVIGEPTAVLFRRGEPERFTERYTQLVDLDMWLRMLQRGRFAFVADPLCKVRMHAAQATGKSIAAGRLSADKRQLYIDYAHRGYMQGSLRDRLMWDFRFAWSLQREPNDARSGTFADAVFYPRLLNVMLLCAAAARVVRPPLPV